MTRTSTFTRPEPTRDAQDALAHLSRPGPNLVLRGNLGLVGVPGVVFTPAAGLGLPAVAFAHDWLQPAERYTELLRHLASWGLVAAAPAGHLNVLPDYQAFAVDLRATLTTCASVRLGEGRISVDSRRMALAGHGTGGGTALLAAAAADPPVAAVVTLAPAQTSPSALDAARVVTAPTLHIVAGRDTVAPPNGHALPLAEAAGGPVWMRTLLKAAHTGFLEGSHWTDLLRTGGPDSKTRRLARGLVTAYLLRHLCEEDRVDELVDGKLRGTDLSVRESR